METKRRERKNQFLVILSDELRAELKKEKVRTGASESELIRRAIKFWIQAKGE